MRTTVQARLDLGSQKTLRRLVRRLDCSPSEVVREGLRLLASCYGDSGGKRVIGLGKFSSGIRDLGSNKKHLKGFGR